jgi:hypothetical protein
VDARTAEVVRELRASGVRAILLKGPTITSWLYGESSQRAYVDTDLLVAEGQLAAAESCLSRLGFTKTEDYVESPAWRQAAVLWIRGSDGAAVDLHRSFDGVGVAPAKVWEALSASTEVMRLAGAEVEVLAPAARAFQIALHAAHHGTTVPKPLDDLGRALEVVDTETWRQAASLAERLGAFGPFATGLRLHPAGRHVAAELAPPAEQAVEVALHPSASPRGALALERLASTPGIHPKLRFVAREIVPTPAFMRYWFPRAARGGGWLALAYLWRPLWLLLRAGPALVAWLRARAAS